MLKTVAEEDYIIAKILLLFCFDIYTHMRMVFLFENLRMNFEPLD